VSVSLGEPLLDIATIAPYLNVDHRTVRNLIRDGKLKAIRVGAQIRVEPAELRRYLDANTAHGGDAA
jgi:excisionase family DNA binding protein